MEDNKNMVTTTETVDNSNQSNDKQEKTYTRDELNKIINAERSKIRAEVLKEEEDKRTEAEKLAKMDAEQKHKYEVQKEIDRANKAESELNAYKLKDQAIKIANEKGLDVSLLDVIDFSKETADTLSSKIDSLDAIYKKAVESGINNALKERSPKYVSNNDTEKETVSRASI